MTDQARETAIQHNAAVIIAGDDEYTERALAAGFVVVGSWPSHQPSFGAPYAAMRVALRKTVPTHLAGVVNVFRGERAPEEWFA